jgi:hypothetical protein
MSLSHSKRSFFAVWAAILFVPVEIGVGIHYLGGWSEIPPLLKSLVLMSIVGIFIVSVGIAAITLGAAIFGLSTYVALAPFVSEPAPSGSRHLGTRAALIILAVLILIAVLWLAWLVAQDNSKASREAAIQREKQEVILFVQNHPGVIARVGGAITASVSMRHQKPTDMPTGYTLYITGAKTGLLEVHLQRSSTSVSFQLGCMRPSDDDPSKVYGPICDWEIPTVPK